MGKFENICLVSTISSVLQKMTTRGGSSDHKLADNTVASDVMNEGFVCGSGSSGSDTDISGFRSIE